MLRLVLAGLVFFAVAPASAQKVVAVASSDLSAYAESLKGLEDVLGAPVPVFTCGWHWRLSSETKVVVAFGGRAALEPYPKEVLVIYCLAPGTHLDPDGPPQSARVPLVPRPDLLAAHLKALQPSLKRLAVLWENDREDYVSGLRKEGARLGLSVRSVQTEAEELPERLRQLQGKIDAVWLAPDPLLVTPQNLQLLVEFSRSAGVALYVPTASLVSEGATAAVAASYAAMGRAAGVAAQRALAGEGVDAELYPSGVDDVVNSDEAQRFGLVVSTSALRAHPDGR